MGVTCGDDANLGVNAPIPYPSSLSPFCVRSLQLTGMVVHLCGKIELMVHSKHALDPVRLGTNRLQVVNSTLMEHSPIKSDANMKVSIGNCFIVSVFVQISTDVYLSHSRSSFYGHPLILPLVFFAPSFPIPRERGNPKRGLTYYNFVAQHHCPRSFVEPAPPPISQDHPIGPPMNISWRSSQNWMDDDQPMDFVEKEVPLDPPVEPT